MPTDKPSWPVKKPSIANSYCVLGFDGSPVSDNPPYVQVPKNLITNNYKEDYIKTMPSFIPSDSESKKPDTSSTQPPYVMAVNLNTPPTSK